MKDIGITKEKQKLRKQLDKDVKAWIEKNGKPKEYPMGLCNKPHRSYNET